MGAPAELLAQWLHGLTSQSDDGRSTVKDRHLRFYELRHGLSSVSAPAMRFSAGMPMSASAAQGWAAHFIAAMPGIDGRRGERLCDSVAFLEHKF
jgi:hypothetical protein